MKKTILVILAAVVVGGVSKGFRGIAGRVTRVGIIREVARDVRNERMKQQRSVWMKRRLNQRRALKPRTIKRFNSRLPNRPRVEKPNSGPGPYLVIVNE